MQPSEFYSPTAPIANGIFSFIGNLLRGIFSFGFLGFFYILLAVLLIAIITLILFLFVRMFEIRQEDAKKKKALATPTAMMSGVAGNPGDAAAPSENQTWKHIRERLLSSNTSDWKLAIIEGDIYLDHVLDDKGFHGDTTGDKLKQVTPDKLPSIQMAWEVHMIRNRIAHEGAAFVLTMPEARRLLSSYEVIFTDLGVL